LEDNKVSDYPGMDGRTYSLEVGNRHSPVSLKEKKKKKNKKCMFHTF
jgi:hypothetical protein